MVIAQSTQSSRASRRFWVGLSGITGVALVWRIFYVVWQIDRIQLNGDAAYYHWQANDVARGLGFIDPGQYELWGRITPSAGHPPAYIVYLAAVSRFIGTSQLTHRLASCVLGAAAVFVIGILARRLFGSDWAGWTAAAFAAVYAHLWINDEMLMSESMYVLTTAIAVWTAYIFWDSPSRRTAALMGAGIGLAVLSRAEAIALVPLLAIPFALLRRERPWRARLGLAAASCVTCALVLAPWCVYNVTRFEHPVLLSNGVGSVLMVANCDYTIPDGVDAGKYAGTYHGRYMGYWSIYCAADLDDKIDRLFPPARARYLKEQLGLIPGTDLHFFGDESTHEVAWRAIGLKEIGRHKRELPAVVAVRVLRMWDFFRPTENISFNAHLEGRGLWQSRLAEVEYFPLLALAITGLVILRRRRVPILPFLALAATVTVTAATTFGITRYRAPVDAMLPVLAGGALVWLVERARASFASPPIAAGGNAAGPGAGSDPSDDPVPVGT